MTTHDDDEITHLHHRLFVGVRVGIRLHVINRLAKILPQYVEETDQLSVRDILDPLSEARQYALRILTRERRAIEHLEIRVPVTPLSKDQPRQFAEISARSRRGSHVTPADARGAALSISARSRRDLGVISALT